MCKTFCCRNCGKTKPANPHLKGAQEYCNDAECQKVRKRLWQKEKMAKDAAYRARQKKCVADWRKNRPQHQYQKHYRETHPEYVEKNRQQQRVRNQKRRKISAESADIKKIVKMDALEMQTIKSGTYMLTPCKMDASGMIVKMDTLLIKLIVCHEDKPLFSHRSR
jgi:hypothetical protein